MDTLPTRVAILATSEKTQQQLSSLLEEAGLNVVANDLPSDNFLSKLEDSTADVLLVDLSEENGSETDIIDTLLDFDTLPIFFNDSSPAGGGANATWAKKLARKLSSVAESFTQPVAPLKVEPLIEQIPVDPGPVENYADTPATSLTTDELQSVELNNTDLLAEPLSLEEISLTDSPEDASPLSELSIEPLNDTETIADNEIEFSLETHDEPDDTKLTLTVEPELPAINDEAAEPSQPTTLQIEKPEGAAVNIWVLGASLGGPQAVRQFLAAVKEDLPVAFVLAQHIGANHISLLAEQLNRVTPFTVVAGKAGHLIKHHEVVLAPADKDICITDDGYLSLIPADDNAIYSPSIDNVMDAIACHYGNMAGTIIFSGMGDDGARGCESIAKYGGIVWAQDVDSCVISSMPDQARKTNTVTYSANPQALAERLYDYYQD